MIKTIITLCISLFSLTGFTQDISGKWNGEVQGSKGPILFVFTIENNNGSYVTTIDVPTQRVSGMKPKTTHFKNSELSVDGSNLGLKYQGKLNQDGSQIVGKFTEGANSFPLVLKKGEPQAKKLNSRPQEPVKPYAYYEKEVTFENTRAKVILSGTLTLPKQKGKSPAVILISGSGPQDRDQTFSGHKTFWVLADYLTQQGIAVLRFDDRGFGKSTGNFSNATTKDFSTDVVSAVDYLKSRTDIDPNNIGLIGHSEGGIIAPLAANQTKDVSFIVLLASTGISGSEISVIQSKTLRPFPVPDEEAYEQAIRNVIAIASSNKDISIIKKELLVQYNNDIAPILKPLVGSDTKVTEIIAGLIEMRTTPWMRYFYNYNPADELEKLSIPVLSLNGSKDTQVLAKINQEGIKNALIKGKNKDFEVLELENLNHLFQECQTGKMDEYNQIEQTFSPVALKEISNWVLGHLN